MNQNILGVLKNFGVLSASNMIGRALSFLLVAYIGRKFGANGLGGHATAQAISAYFIFFADLGLASRLVREGAACPEYLGREYALSQGNKLALIFSASIIVLILYSLLPYVTSHIGQGAPSRPI